MKQKSPQKIFEERSKDWRNRQIVYQIFVDRFAKSKAFVTKNKEELFSFPRKLREWTEKPEVGKPLEEFGCWSHEVDFWGGDLQGVTERIPYLKELGVNTIYLNPIFSALTNHKYDALDYFTIDPQFGTWDDLKNLTDAAHREGMKVILDGVFNHVGRKSKWFEEAQKSPSSPYRSYFYFGDQYKHGYRTWANVKNLPELNLENPDVQSLIFTGMDSVVVRYLQLVDGWRLDVAFELGPDILNTITENSHKARKGSLVTGEIWNYPDGWLQVMDGIMDYPMRHVILEMLKGEISPWQAGRFVERMVNDSGIEKMLKCWTILSSHDTARLKELVPDADLRKMALVLQYTLPGAPIVYYGEELGMTGKDDPCNRGPMEWDRFSPKNAEFQFYKSMIELRTANPALQYGDFQILESEQFFAFSRNTDCVKDLVIVVTNPRKEATKGILLIPEHKLMNWGKLQDIQTQKHFSVFCGMLTLEMPPKSYCILKPIVEPEDGYTPYKRVK